MADLELHNGDRVIYLDDPKDDWIIASIDHSEGTAQLARFDQRRSVPLTRLQLARTHNKPIDTPVRHGRVTEF